MIQLGKAHVGAAGNGGNSWKGELSESWKSRRDIREIWETAEDRGGLCRVKGGRLQCLLVARAVFTLSVWNSRAPHSLHRTAFLWLACVTWESVGKTEARKAKIHKWKHWTDKRMEEKRRIRDRWRRKRSGGGVGLEEGEDAGIKVLHCYQCYLTITEILL